MHKEINSTLRDSIFHRPPLYMEVLYFFWLIPSKDTIECHSSRASLDTKYTHNQQKKRHRQSGEGLTVVGSNHPHWQRVDLEKGSPIDTSLKKKEQRTNVIVARSNHIRHILGFLPRESSSKL
jgi:hypothetical protein